MLIDRHAPHYDATEVHRIFIEAPPEVVWRELWRLDLLDSRVVRGLLAVRSLPGWLRGERRAGRADRRPSRLTLADLIESDFGRLDEEPGRELVLGVEGRFWRPTGNLSPFDRVAFAEPVPAGTARAYWNFLVTGGPEGSELFTETRIVCGDASSRRRFRAYWLLVRPFSGLIRVRMLRAVRRACRGVRSAG